jgi:hypothetical protein
MTRGLDADGQVAALIVWDPRSAWRVAVSDGDPPPDVTNRENELIECMEGRRTVDSFGNCLTSDIEE